MRRSSHTWEAETPSPADVLKDFWERNPCSAKEVALFPEGSPEFFEAMDRQRYQGDDFMHQVIGFKQWVGKRVLEIGCGLGSDLLQFAKGGVEVFGLDLTEKAIRLTERRLSLYGYKSFLCMGNAENLPFPNDYFDLVYAWGVIHHTLNPRQVVREMSRVLKSGGHILL